MSEDTWGTRGTWVTRVKWMTTVKWVTRNTGVSEDCPKTLDSPVVGSKRCVFDKIVLVEVNCTKERRMMRIVRMN